MASLNDIETKVQNIIDILIGDTIIGTLPLTFTTHTAGNVENWEIEGNDEAGENLYGVNASVSISTVSVVCSGSEIAIESDGTNATVSATAANWKNNLSVSLSAGSYGYKIERTGTTTGIITSIYDANNTSIGSSQTSGIFTLPADTSVYMGFYISANTTANGTIKLIITKGSTAPDHYIPYQQGVGKQRQDGYYVPLTISQAGKPDKTVDIFIGDSPLTEGETVSKASTGVDLELFEGENTISTSLYNKPTMEIKYKWR